ncbi:MAG: DUF3867 domain-containing protein [Clostridium sp.]
MDEKVIDFNELKNKVKDTDIDKFEGYMYELYYKMSAGQLGMADFTKEIHSYMEKNNISQDKFIKMQKKLMERYGMPTEMLDEQLKMAGLNLGGAGDYEKIRKTMSFQEKYKSRVKNKAQMSYSINNDKNDVEVLLDGENVTVLSNKKVDLADLELNELFVSYKKLNNDNPLKVRICESIRDFEY